MRVRFVRERLWRAVAAVGIGAALAAGGWARADLPADSNVILTAPSTSTGTVSIKTLTLSAQNNDVALLIDPGSVLTISQSQLNSQGPFLGSISGGAITAGNDDLQINVTGGDLTISSGFQGPGLAVEKFGAGNL